MQFTKCLMLTTLELQIIVQPMTNVQEKPPWLTWIVVPVTEHHGEKCSTELWIRQTTSGGKKTPSGSLRLGVAIYLKHIVSDQIKVMITQVYRVDP
ncbi:MAG: hypothetical protein A2Z04_00880 [Chloroflexi bacterium RBG_16_57_9]|nr:MAG: hypothetical protein A2Z04_00880 [Chloroflexi bacterium RBG_16_57_9]